MVKKLMTKEKNTKMGIVLLTLFVSGTIVGSGVYMLPASLANFGSIGLLAWVLTAIGAIFLALVFAKMGALFPAKGGPYAYAHAEFGDYIGFQTAYCYWIAAFVGNASLIPPIIGYVSVFFPNAKQYSLLIGLGLVWLFAIINLYGVRNVGIVGAVTTILKFMPILVVTFLGWQYFNPANITQSFNISGQPAIHVLTLAAALTLWSFVGVESATVPAGDIIKPRYTIPIATILGTLIAAMAYIVTCTSIMGMMPMKELAACESPFAAAGKIILGSWGAYFITFGALFSLLGGLNAWTLLETQVAMAAANDGLFPGLFAVKNRYGVPVWGIIITTIIISFLLIISSSMNIIKQFEVFILAATTMQVIPYLYTSVAEFIYMIRHRKIAAHFKAHIFIAIIGTLFSFWAIVGSGYKIVYFVMLFILMSIPLYAIVVCQRKYKH
jgi:basic amino acid/polyamine antiporter, APA family